MGFSSGFFLAFDSNEANNQAITQNVDAADDSSQQQLPSWFEKLPDKFKAKDKTPDQIIENVLNSYVESEKLHSRVYGAPQEYKVEAAEVDPVAINLFNNTAKKLNLSQKMYNEIINNFIESEREYLAKVNQEIEEAKTKIGAERIGKVKNFIGGLSLSAEQAKQVSNSFGGSVQAFEILETIVNKFTAQFSNNQPVSSTSSIDANTARHRIEEIYNHPEWKNGKKYYKFKEELAQLYKAAG